MEISRDHDSMPSPLPLQAMSQQRYVQSQDDDWTGVTSTSERRRLQNRLNQRAYRKYKPFGPVRRQGTITVYQELLGVVGQDENKTKGNEDTAAAPRDAVSLTLQEEGYKMLTAPQRRDNVIRFAREAYERYALGAPRPSQLGMLVKLNVLNALARNARLIGLPNDRVCDDDAISPFSLSGPLPLPLPDQTLYPEALKPTAVQYSVLHHPWIDLLPFPVMRERAIRAVSSGVLDEDEIVLDLIEVWPKDAVHTPFLIVWGDSSNPGDWEATLPFLEKYGWLVWGCTELFESTNKWRSKRGEKLLGL
ncbi:hypothetical protein PFICI_09206 [Pestalotiopsis fici W106-1]|uniref:BZIP domain-containing protein n=1 Tax=Pestalotiopsis fici (strain W106-1 / CGMCC3.15140) TaxID=1229662 RepID=W3WZP4_PESFW|nr:uncharacterized protein PFICI_09206 [Pestalotiopsis fici W106-1]ETS79353.1 hypothetical protein PFICI_09206 [Pestalotiopsis fici W106-1]